MMKAFGWGVVYEAFEKRFVKKLWRAKKIVHGVIEMNGDNEEA